MSNIDYKVLIDAYLKSGHSRLKIAEVLDELNLNSQADDARAYLNDAFKNTTGKLAGLGLSLEKVESEPPEYVFHLRGHPKAVRVTLAELHSKLKLDLIMFGAFDYHPLAGIKNDDWRGIIEAEMASGSVAKIESEVSLERRIILALKASLHQLGEGHEYQDLEAGCYVQAINGGQKCYCFLSRKLLTFVPRHLGHPVKAADIEFALRSVGLRYGREAAPVRVGKDGKQYRLWVVPCSELDAIEAPVEEEQQDEMPPEI